ncbi:MAG: hypothetical protein NZ960_06005 [Candidatus Kapabacteria bacterium]|nr:hypothetical protein [Candidatus Kapabacteria bacterium]MDW8012529.1 hypothetical protein [Bacteroidota bacterium]
MSLRLSLGCWVALAAVTLLCDGCASARPQGSVIELYGVINPLRLDSRVCWILETGGMRDKAFYELRGPDRILQRLQQENLRARIRGVLRPECTPTCGVGTCVEVIEILELQR